MKILTNKQFPHPILWAEKNDYKESSKFDINLINKKNSRMEIRLEFEAILENSEIKDLIKNNLARMILHLECSNTQYRGIEDISLGTNKIVLDRTKIEGDLQIVPLLISNDDLKDFHSSDFKNLYSTMKFNISKGDILAIGKQIIYPVDKTKEKLTGMSSIIGVEKGFHPKGVILDPSEKKIKLIIPEDDYDRYSFFGNSDNYKKIIQSSLVIPALVHLVGTMDNPGLVSEYEELRWFRMLKKTLLKKGYDVEDMSTIAQKSLEIVQDLFDNPLSNVFDEVEKLVEEGEQ